MDDIKKIERLFEPINIGRLQLKNRTVFAPMIVGLGGNCGEVTRDTIEYYVETARSGVGLLTIEGVNPCEKQKGQGRQLSITKNEDIAGFSAVVRAVRTHVMDPPKIAIQLVAFGRETEPEVSNNMVFAPSSIPSVLHPMFKDMKRTKLLKDGVPQALSIDEIIEIEDEFVDSAERAMLAGVDAVEIHAAHGYLIAQFLSAFTNKRADLYGNDKTLLLRNIITKTKKRLGEDFPIIVRVSGDEFIAGGATIDERQSLARHLEQLGCAAISVSGGIYETGYYIIPPMMIKHGCHIENAAKIKEVVNIPVYAAGRINDPRLAEKALLDSKVDLVAFGRPLIADREFLSKAAEGRFDDIRKCIACNTCLDALFEQKRIECTVNPALGDPLIGERRFERACRKKSAIPKRVVIVGGGPGGMEAARIAAMKGHDVTIYEKNDYLGGNLIPAAAVSFKKEINSLLRYQRKQMEVLNVKVQLGKEVTGEEIAALDSDRIILASGSTPILPNIPGIEMYKDKVFSPTDILNGKGIPGKNVVVVGGGMVGCEAAIFLREKGHNVKLVTRRSAEFAHGRGLAADWGSLCRLWLLTVKWPTLGIEVHQLAQYNEITAEGLITVNRDWKETLIKADSIVFCLGFKRNNELEDGLRKAGLKFFAIGDCRSPRRIIDAIREGAVCAYQI